MAGAVGNLCCRLKTCASHERSLPQPSAVFALKPATRQISAIDSAFPKRIE